MDKTFDMSVDIRKAIQAMDRVREKTPYIVMNTLNDVGFELRSENQSRMDSIFSQGATEFTKRAVVIDKATLSNATTTVRHQPIQAHYLGLQEFGGIDDRSRPAGKKEPVKLAIPMSDRVPLDSHGNIPEDYVNTTARSNPKEFFIGKPKRAPGVQTMKGLWRRVGQVQTSTGRTAFAKVIPYVLFVRNRLYKKGKYEFREWALKRAGEKLPQAFAKSLKYEVERILNGGR